MLISFYEEFPDENNLSKLKLIKFPTKLYIASKSVEEFNQIKSKIKSPYVKEIIYWPTLTKEEGYWLSPFSNRKAILRTISELKDSTIPVMWDSELPFRHPLLFFKEFPNFFRNKRLIKNFLEFYPKVYISESFSPSYLHEKLLRFLGISFKYSPNIYTIKMTYSSMHDFGKYLIEQQIIKGKNNYKNNFMLAFGVLTQGILGNEPAISTKLLERDLNLAKKHNLSEVVIFRLGGLSKKYLKILSQ